MIKYLGSKRVLLPRITAAIAALPEVRTVLDLFSGTARVGHGCKQAGYRVLANDHNAYAATLARCYVQSDREDVLVRAESLLDELRRVPARAGWFTETYGVKSRYLQPENGARIEAIRNEIARLDLDPELHAVVLTSLMEAADRVDSTTGVQMAYLKQWAPRSFQQLELRMPAVVPRAAAGKGAAFELDAESAVAQLAGDVAYVDPPYNQHKYLGNYHVWESLVRWDAPDVYGVACKRVDCRTRPSDFNSKVRTAPALRRIVTGLQARHLVVSFNDEGYVRPEELIDMLQARGHVWSLACDHARYVGARIGIHNAQGERVGKVSHLRNREFLFVVSPDAVPRSAVARALRAQGYTKARKVTSRGRANRSAPPG